MDGAPRFDTVGATLAEVDPVDAAPHRGGLRADAKARRLAEIVKELSLMRDNESAFHSRMLDLRDAVQGQMDAAVAARHAEPDSPEVLQRLLDAEERCDRGTRGIAELEAMQRRLGKEVGEAARVADTLLSTQPAMVRAIAAARAVVAERDDALASANDLMFGVVDDLSAANTATSVASKAVGESKAAAHVADESLAAAEDALTEAVAAVTAARAANDEAQARTDKAKGDVSILEAELEATTTARANQLEEGGVPYDRMLERAEATEDKAARDAELAEAIAALRHVTHAWAGAATTDLEAARKAARAKRLDAWTSMKDTRAAEFAKVVARGAFERATAQLAAEQKHEGDETANVAAAKAAEDKAEGAVERAARRVDADHGSTAGDALSIATRAATQQRKARLEMKRAVARLTGATARRGRCEDTLDTATSQLEAADKELVGRQVTQEACEEVYAEAGRQWQKAQAVYDAATRAHADAVARTRDARAAARAAHTRLDAAHENVPALELQATDLRADDRVKTDIYVMALAASDATQVALEAAARTVVERTAATEGCLHESLRARDDMTAHASALQVAREAVRVTEQELTYANDRIAAASERVHDAVSGVDSAGAEFEMQVSDLEPLFASAKELRRDMLDASDELEGEWMV